MVRIFIGVVGIVGLFSVLSWIPAHGQKTSSARSEKPPIDQAAPAKIQTATFALG